MTRMVMSHLELKNCLQRTCFKLTLMRFHFGRKAEKASRRQTKFLFYMIVIELFKDILIRVAIGTNPKEITLCIAEGSRPSKCRCC